MAGEPWPSSLPDYPRTKGFSRTKGDGRIFTPMQQGAPRARRLYEDVPDQYTVSYTLDLAQWEIFEDYWDNTLNGGVKTIDMPIKTPSGNKVVEVFVLKLGKQTPVGNNNIRFTMTVLTV